MTVLTMTKLPVKACPLCGKSRPLNIVYAPMQIHQCRCGMMYRNIDYIPENKSGVVFSKGEDRQPMFARRINMVEDLIGNREIESVLIVGCGMGHEIKAWQPAAKRVEGIDLCEKAIERAQAQGLPADLCSLEDAAENYGRYDVIICGDLLEHVYDLGSAIDSLSELVEPDGIVIIDVPETDNPWVSISDFYTPEHLWHFTLRTLPRMMGNHGFGCLEMRHDRNNIVGAFSPVDGYSAVFEEYTDLRQEELLKCAEMVDSLPKPYAAWGFGEFFGVLKANMPSFDPKWVVDSGMEGMEPDIERLRTYRAVVVCSREYKDEIKKQLRQLGYRGKVFCPADKPWMA